MKRKGGNVWLVEVCQAPVIISDIAYAKNVAIIVVCLENNFIFLLLANFDIFSKCEMSQSC